MGLSYKPKFLEYQFSGTELRYKTISNFSQFVHLMQRSPPLEISFSLNAMSVINKFPFLQLGQVAKELLSYLNFFFSF